MGTGTLCTLWHTSAGCQHNPPPWRWLPEPSNESHCSPFQNGGDIPIRHQIRPQGDSTVYPSVCAAKGGQRTARGSARESPEEGEEGPGHEEIKKTKLLKGSCVTTLPSGFSGPASSAGCRRGGEAETMLWGWVQWSPGTGRAAGIRGGSGNEAEVG